MVLRKNKKHFVPKYIESFMNMFSYYFTDLKLLCLGLTFSRVDLKFSGLI